MRFEGDQRDTAMASLSLHDLLEARDAYHVHLLRLENVVATAVGRYLVRNDEHAEASEPIESWLARPPGERPPRTVGNSSVRPESWPCVLAFVRKWMTAEEIRDQPDEMVPRRLYLPDGKQIPTCVVYAPDVDPGDEEQQLSFPSALLGGGYVCLADVQGHQHVGSIACLVSDGEKTYALTNRHIAGEAGRALYTLIDGAEVPIGRSAGRSVGRRPFRDVYPGFAGERVELAIDAGLIEVDDLRDWTTQVFGVGQLAEMVDIRPESLTLDLIGQPVRAFGAASGALEGEVAALYYRYATRSGVEYLADAIVGPGPHGSARTRPGDSGTIWVLAGTGDGVAVRPLALQWGGHRFALDDRRVAPYALVTFLSTACRALDVEPVYDWNTGHDLYWGEVGHYTIGARACDLVKPAGLRDFFVENRNRISFELDDIRAGEFETDDNTVFFPLADVPDRVWKRRERGVGRPHEGPNHFADMDDPRPGDDETLMSLFEQNPDSVSPEEWIAFYEAKGFTPRQMGLLPFRVAQLYELMVAAVAAGDSDAALAAGGVMAHYVGDACQPLHVSRLHDGRNDAEKGVHSAYETNMVTSRRAQIIDGLDHALAGDEASGDLRGGRAAAIAVVELMQRAVKRLPPERICDTYAESHRVADLWDALGDATIECMADGCRTLASLWSSAWKEAGAQAPPPRAADKIALRRLYDDASFASSLYLTELAATPTPA